MRMRVDAKFSERDLGMKNLLKLMNTLKNPRSLDIGLVDAPQDVVNRGMWNEYDSEHAPARPWFSTTFDTYQKGWMDAWEKEFWNIFRNPDSGKTAIHLQEFLGKMASDDMRNMLEEGSWDENAESTIKKKGFNWPLVETGELSDSITFKIYKSQGRKK